PSVSPARVDWLALAFAAMVVLYALIPQDVLGGHATHKATAYALRHDLAAVGAYFLGRAVAPPPGNVRWLVLGLAAAVAARGAPLCSSSCRPQRGSSGRTRAPPCSRSPSG